MSSDPVTARAEDDRVESPGENAGNQDLSIRTMTNPAQQGHCHHHAKVASEVGRQPTHFLVAEASRGPSRARKGDWSQRDEGQGLVRMLTAGD